MHLVFVRHGRPDGAAGRCLGATDVALSADGLASVRTLATAWHAAGARSVTGAPARVVTSNLRRAMDSARVFGLLWQRSIEVDPRVREMDFGAWDGQLWQTIEATDGERLRAWTDRWTDVAPPGGESLHALADRARDWIADLRASARPRSNAAARASTTVVVVTHAGWIRVAVAQLLGRQLADMFNLPVDYGHATVVRVGARRSEVIALNTRSIP